MFLRLSFLLHFIAAVIKPPTAIIKSNFRKAKEFLSIRAGKEGQQYVWLYSGIIRNPLSGGEVRIINCIVTSV